MATAAALNEFGSDDEDISGFTGDLSSTDSLVSSRGNGQAVDGKAKHGCGPARTDDDDPSSGPDGFNEVGEVFVRFKPLACRPGTQKV